MLTQLLPGFRELRAPLVTGIVWMISAWVLFGDDIPNSSHASGFLKRLYELGEQVGRPAVGVAIVFTAYLVGSILSVSASSILNFSGWIRWATTVKGGRNDGDPDNLHDLQEEFGKYVTYGRLLTRHGNDDLHTYIDNLPLFEWCKINHEPPHEAVRPDRLMCRYLSELSQLRTRLHASNVELFGDCDRLTAEADLRINSGLSVGVFSIALAATVTPWLLFGLALTAILVTLGIRHARQANDVIVQAMIVGTITSPVTAETAQWLETAKREIGERNRISNEAENPVT